MKLVQALLFVSLSSITAAVPTPLYVASNLARSGNEKYGGTIVGIKRNEKNMDDHNLIASVKRDEEKADDEEKAEDWIAWIKRGEEKADDEEKAEDWIAWIKK